ncbi:F-box protein At3g07870-like [Impatiens glandulifera]|uniref:F-box protein At3g07870-like n=1 Tax=Impatiens glandulifera TaxID=253017 RepID=UPI001FB07550|nr:F-box protein At3g07870-like [Impatiens glandulifera]
MTVLNSTRGLLCLQPYCYSGPHCVFNPFTLEFTLIPDSVKGIKEYSVLSYGFGYCPISDKYKVLKIIKLWNLNGNNPPLLTTEIYTLGTPSWRRVQDAPMVVYNDYVPTFLNGSLHWMINEQVGITIYNSYGYMISFDLNNEKYGQVALPPPLDIGRDRKHMKMVTLGVFEGWLSVFVLNSNKSLDVWAMKEYGVRESWAREIVVDTSLFFLSHRSFPVNYVNDGEDVLFFNADYGIFTYKLFERRIVNCIKFTGWRPNDDYEAKALNHVPILLSLNELVVGAQVHRLTGR